MALKSNFIFLLSVRFEMIAIPFVNGVVCSLANYWLVFVQLQSLYDLMYIEKLYSDIKIYNKIKPQKKIIKM